MTALVLLILVITAALLLRRNRPVAVLVTVTAAVTLSGWIAPEQVFFVPGDTLLVMSLADLVALFTLSAHCSRRTTALAVAGLTLWQVTDVLLTGSDPLDVVVGGATYGIVAAAGRIRHRWLADREAAARRLAEAERARHEAAEVERRRLARELHDVTAHHLTSIVVQASAAQFLGTQRPELRTEALTFAARTGHEALTDLRRLVAVLPYGELTPDPTPTLSDLADDFRHLGQTVLLDLTEEPPPGTAGNQPPGTAGNQPPGTAGEQPPGTAGRPPGTGGRPPGTAGEQPPGTAEQQPPGTAGAQPPGMGEAELVGAPAGVAEAVRGIAREALTNTLRYAPGATVRIGLTRRATEIELVVEDNGPAGTATAKQGTAGLGGGRGIAGMRERAVALGGTVEAGPRDGGGWRVRAVFPRALRVPLKRSLLRSQAVLDAALAMITLALPLAGVAGLATESPAATALVLLAVIAHAAPLMWRRRAPWLVFAIVTATTWLGPLLLVTGVMSDEDTYLFLFSVGADLAAVYAVASRGSRPGLTWIAPVVSLVNTALTLSVLVNLGQPRLGPIMFVIAAGFLTVIAAVILALPMGAAWLAGRATRRRRQRRLEREEGAVVAVTAQAELRTRDERARVAAGLHAAVLSHAARVPLAAERADLDGVLEAGKGALAAMRELLDDLGSADKPSPEVSSSPFG
ncbi:histidine kinase [Actinoplanes sp. NPDC051861]|uniref:histidine kinase n=1 Tax=Actinoplanes sp. NPDC051861 TaxID=3155170 RepID=UPI0034359B47